MKSSILLLATLAITPAFSQNGNTTALPSFPESRPTPDTVSYEPLQKLPDEGTNDPVSTGSVKHTINGINYYFKENENISILFIEEKK